MGTYNHKAVFVVSDTASYNFKIVGNVYLFFILPNVPCNNVRQIRIAETTMLIFFLQPECCKHMHCQLSSNDMGTCISMKIHC